MHGDGDIIRAAVEGRGNSSLKLLVVPALTSLNEQGLRELGHGGSVAELIDDAGQAWRSTAASTASSPARRTIRMRSAGVSTPSACCVVTPGVRLAGAALDDHKRSGTPAQAIADGADYLVVGRPIVQADDPAEVAARFVADMKARV